MLTGSPEWVRDDILRQVSNNLDISTGRILVKHSEDIGPEVYLQLLTPDIDGWSE